MVTLEMVEKLRKYANISYEEAKEALEESDGDILEAIINLEKQNRIETPHGGGYYNSEEGHQGSDYNINQQKENSGPSKDRIRAFGEMIGKFFGWAGKIIKRGNKNSFEVTKGSDYIISVPVTIFVLLSLFAFWLVVPLIIVGLFFGYRYRFKGPDLGKESINHAMNSVADAAESLKKEFRGDNTDGKNSDN